MGPLTTHVLNTATGLPAVNIRLTIERSNGDIVDNGSNWQKIGETYTNADGRAPNLLSSIEEVCIDIKFLKMVLVLYIILLNMIP